jgi:hypothetical protein
MTISRLIRGSAARQEEAERAVISLISGEANHGGLRRGARASMSRSASSRKIALGTISARMTMATVMATVATTTPVPAIRRSSREVATERRSR